MPSDPARKLSAAVKLIRAFLQGAPMEDVCIRGLECHDVLLDLHEPSDVLETVSSSVPAEAGKVQWAAREAIGCLLYNQRDDPFLSLGLSPFATKEEIHKRWKKMIALYHPDRYGDKRENEEKAKKINDAYNRAAAQREAGAGRTALHQPAPQKKKGRGPAGDLRGRSRRGNSFNLNIKKYSQYAQPVVIIASISIMFFSVIAYIVSPGEKRTGRPVKAAVEPPLNKIDSKGHPDDKKPEENIADMRCCPASAPSDEFTRPKKEPDEAKLNPPPAASHKHRMPSKITGTNSAKKSIACSRKPPGEKEEDYPERTGGEEKKSSEDNYAFYDFAMSVITEQQKEPGLTDEIHLLLGRLAESRQKGDFEEYVSLFADGATENGREVATLSNKGVFTKAEGYSIKNVFIRIIDKDNAEVSADYVYKKSPRESALVHGSINFHVEKTGDSFKIRELSYKE